MVWSIPQRMDQQLRPIQRLTMEVAPTATTVNMIITTMPGVSRETGNP